MNVDTIRVIQSIYEQQTQLSSALGLIESKLDASHFYGVPVAILGALGASALTALAALGAILVQHKLQAKRDSARVESEKQVSTTRDAQEYYEQNFIIDGIEPVQQILQEWRLCIDRATLALTTNSRMPDEQFPVFREPERSFRLSTLTNTNAVYVFLWYLHAQISVLYNEAVSDRKHTNFQKIEVLLRDALACFRQIQATMHLLKVESKSDIYNLWKKELGSDIRAILDSKIELLKKDVGISIRDGDYNPNFLPECPSGDTG